MNIFYRYFFLFIVTSVVIARAEQSIPAFPGAEGGGAFASGGRGGQVVFVTSLEDADTIPGTLRWALNQKSPKTILFKVAGIINLKSELKISKPNTTIAGQSAPGDGICIKGYPVLVSADNIIIRFLRFRMGDENQVQDDALKGNKRKNIIIDHCSMSWSTDECSSFYDNVNFTMQWCVISESLKNSVHKKGAHGYGGIWGGTNASFHHNLLAHHDSRNPRFCGSRFNGNQEQEHVDFRNNVIYNWGSNSVYGAEGGTYNLVNNYYKPGPATSLKGKTSYRIISPNADPGVLTQEKGVWGKFFISGNYIYGNKSVTKNNLLGFHPDVEKGDTVPKNLLTEKMFEHAAIRTSSALKAYKEVLKKAGASLVRDAVDIRITEELSRGSFTYTGSNGGKNGIIDSQQDVGGWPEYKFNQTQVLPDRDADGIPDAWELRKGLNPDDKSDGIQLHKNKYTWLEVYLNELVAKQY